MNRVIVGMVFLTALVLGAVAPRAASAQTLQLRQPFAGMGHGRLLAQNFQVQGGVGYGAPPPVAYGQPGYGPPPGPGVYGQPGMMQQPGQARVDRANELLVARVIISPLIGYAIGTALALVGGLVGVLAGCSNGTFESCVGGAVIGIYAGYLIGTPIGVTWASSWFSGLGNFGWAFLGTLAGVAVAIPLSYAIGNGGAYYGLGLLPPIGATIFYELGGGIRANQIRNGLAVLPNVSPIIQDGRAIGTSFGLRVTNF